MKQLILIYLFIFGLVAFGVVFEIMKFVALLKFVLG
jgi:hypothetical protein